MSGQGHPPAPQGGPSPAPSLRQPAPLVSHFMYLRAILCTFQISVDFYYVPVGGRGGAGEGGVGG